MHGRDDPRFGEREGPVDVLEGTDVIPQYYDDVPIEDDYLVQVPELTALDDRAGAEPRPELVAEYRARREGRRVDADVLVVGGGISGMQAALDIADKGYRVVLVEKTATIGGNMVKLDKTFPTNDCSICTSAPKMVEVSRHPNIRLMTYAEVQSLEGEAGDLVAHVFRKSRYVDPEKCTGCDDCVPVCPVEVVSGFEERLSRRKAIYIEFPQAVPIVYTIDYDNCVGCGSCERVCEPGAISFLEKSEDVEVHVGSVIVATGYELFEPLEMRKEYGYGKYANVITALQFERLLSSFGPTEGKVKRPSDGQRPRSVAWVQCVGSRSKQLGFPYCSRVCCMYATKEAAITKEADPGIDVTIFYMDIRAYGKDFQQYYEKAKAAGVEYVRARPSSVFENPDGSITVRYMDTHTREVGERTVDLLVLSTAIIPSKENARLAGVLGIGIDGSGFFETGSIMEDPMRSTRPGVFLAGCDQGPKDIPDSVAMASGAAAKAMAAVVGREKAAPAPLPEERPVAGETPRIGVFVCHCGKNIHGFLDTEEVAAYARGLPHVEFATDVMFACSEDTIKSIRDQVSEKGLNRVIVAACSPVTHAGLFQDTMVEAGLNKYLFEFANIRQHCSWVHSRDRRTATDKAKALVRMAARKSSLLEPLAQEEVPVTPAVLIVGGGIAGMRTALALADMRVRSFIVEKEPELGGILLRLHSLFPLDLRAEDVVAPLADRVLKSEYVEVLTDSTLESVEGFIGNFEAKVSTPRGERRISFGTAVIASGFREIDLTGRYGYGSSGRVVTQAGLEERLKAGDLPPLKSVVFINCAGAMEPERPWCCRVGCGVSIKNARLLKELNPGADVHILYRDIRVFGKDEEEYFTDVVENRRVKIVRYSLERPPEVAVDGENVTVRVHDEIYGDDLEIPADLVVLTAQTEGSETAGALMDMFKVPAGPGQFLIEAHAKIRPLDFATDGVYFCGSAHYPKNLADTIAQAEGAASRAAIPIMKGRLVLEGITASVDKEMCVGCGLCIAACPYAAIELKDGRAVVNNALCKGCGLCAATCRSGAVQQRGFNDLQVISMIRGALHEVM